MTTKPKTNPVERFFGAWRSLVIALESSAIEMVSATTPWLAPIIPASQTYAHALNSLHYSEPVSFIAAASVEFLGLAAVSTAVEFWNYNDAQAARRESRLATLDKEQRKIAKSRRSVGAPFRLAFLSGVFYIAVILTVNILLDIGKPFPQVAANVLLSLLSVPAAVIIAIRSQHRRKTTEKARKVESVAESAAEDDTPSNSVMESATDKPRTYAEYVSLSAERNGSGPLSTAELLELGVGKSSAYLWPNKYAAEFSVTVGK